MLVLDFYMAEDWRAKRLVILLGQFFSMALIDTFQGGRLCFNEIFWKFINLHWRPSKKASTWILSMLLFLCFRIGRKIRQVSRNQTVGSNRSLMLESVQSNFEQNIQFDEFACCQGSKTTKRVILIWLQKTCWSSTKWKFGWLNYKVILMSHYDWLIQEFFLQV